MSLWGARYKLQVVPMACVEDLALLCDAGSPGASAVAALNPVGFTAAVGAARLHGHETSDSPHTCLSLYQLGLEAGLVVCSALLRDVHSKTQPGCLELPCGGLVVVNKKLFIRAGLCFWWFI